MEAGEGSVEEEGEGKGGVDTRSSKLCLIFNICVCSLRTVMCWWWK